MTVSALSNLHSPMISRLGEMRAEFADLQQQLSSGLKSDTYGGLGRLRGLDVAMRSRLSEVGAWQDSITHVSLRLNFLDQTFTRIGEISTEVRQATDPNVYEVLGNGKTSSQSIAKAALSEMVGLLNNDVAGRYMFAGRDVDNSPIEDLDKILLGDGTNAGFEQVIDERRQADLGPNARGRVNASVVGTDVTIAEDGSHPFGFKLAGISETLSNGTVTAPAGAPASATASLTGQPNVGEMVRLYVDMPDGSSTTIEVIASADGSQPNSFMIGATAADTATNLSAAINTALAGEAATTLRAASAVQASEDFFNTEGGAPPQRVDGPPFDTATAMRSGAGDTIDWYTGDNSASDPRSSVTARVDETVTVGYGLRANETGIRRVFQSLAVFSVEKFTPDDSIDKARYAELASRMRLELSEQDGVESVQSLQVEFATTHYTVDAARDRHKMSAGTLTEIVEDIERADLEEVAAKLVTMQTRLQASYQATALLSEMSLANYI